MTAPDHGPGASRYAALADLEPGVADAVVAALRDAGVAAYAAVADIGAAGAGAADTAEAGASGPAAGPHSDRLTVWVDADEVERARAVLHTRLPDLRMAERTDGGAESGIDEEAAWQAIVAGYDVTGAEPARPEPARAEPAGPERAGAEPASPEPALSGPAERSAGDDHYVPPPPPPLPAVDAVTKLGWAGVIGGPAYLLIATVTGRGLSEQGAVIAVAAFVVGFVTLVARMKDRPPMDSGPDDGAVV